MKNYYNNTFYNIVLPILLFLSMIGMVIGFCLTENPMFGLGVFVVCVGFKFIHNILERKSLQQRRDYKLYNAQGQYHPGSLSNKTEAEVQALSREYAISRYLQRDKQELTELRKQFREDLSDVESFLK